MKNQFIPYELALTLKELSFDEKCFMHYENSEGQLYESFGSDYMKNSTLTDWETSAPLWQQAFDWLLEKYKLFPETTLWGDGIGYITKIKQIRQEEFLEVYDLGIVPENKGIPNWDYKKERFYALEKMIKIAQKENKNE